MCATCVGGVRRVCRLCLWASAVRAAKAHSSAWSIHSRTVNTPPRLVPVSRSRLARSPVAERDLEDTAAWWITELHLKAA